MIRTKENLSSILNELDKFEYVKEDEQIEVCNNDNSKIKFICYSSKCIKIEYHDYEEAISLLYKDRKYINKVLFQ